MSRSFVGSSRTSTFIGRVNSRASRSRLRSPPDSALTGEMRAFWRKQKIAQVSVDVLRLAIHGHRVVAFADGVEHRALGVELLALLVVVRDLHVRAASNLAGIRLELAHQHPQQRGLARTVRPDQANAIAAYHAERRVPHDQTFPE